MRVLVPVVVCVLALGGCGGGEEPLSKADYEREMQAILEPIQQDPPDTSRSTPEELAATFEELRDRIRQVTEDMDELSPPSDVAGAHDDYTEALRGLADGLAPLIEALRDGDQAEAARLFASGSFISAETGERFDSARAAFERAGVQISEPFP